MNKCLHLLLFAQFAVIPCSLNRQAKLTAGNTNLHIDQDRIFIPVIINALDTLEMLSDIDDPVVGTILLQHFNMILDLKHDQLILTPALNAYPFKYMNSVRFWCYSKGVVIRIKTNGTTYG